MTSSVFARMFVHLCSHPIRTDKRPATTDGDPSTVAPTISERGLVGTLAFDLQLRPHSRLAFQPGVTMYRRLDNGQTRWQVGVAFKFGKLPFYGDVPP